MGHGHAPELEISDRIRRRLVAAAVALAVLTLIGAVLLRPTGRDRPDLVSIGVSSELFDATVVFTEPGACSGTEPADAVVCDFLTIELDGGPDAGGTESIELPFGPANPGLGEGDRIVVAATEGEGGGGYVFVDRQRRPALIGLAVLFALVVVVLGRVRGLTALVGLVGTIAVLLTFALPGIIDGRPPLFVAIVAASAIAFLALYLSHGFGLMTTVALLGTLASLALTAVLATFFVWVAQFSGFASEEAFFLDAAGGSINLEGLLLAGVVIGALGAVDDMTVTQASAVWELRAANPVMPFGELYAAGIRIGRDHVASTVNTLVLAYAGASLPLLLLFVLGGQSLGSVANTEVVASEIVRTLVGSIGLVSAVPLTTWLAARVLPRAHPEESRSERPG